MAGEAAGGPAVLAVEVAWVQRDGSTGSLAIGLPAGACVRDALAVLRNHPAGAAPAEALARAELAIAIYGEHCDAATPLHPGDRLELLGALQVDPKLARRRRAEMRRKQAAPAAQGRGRRDGR